MRGIRTACCAIAWTAAASAWAQSDATSAAAEGPRIRVETTEFSFGRVPNDRAVEKVFRVANTGTKPLVITRVQTSCGCTAAMMESSVIEAGKSGKLRVSFNPRGLKQTVTRTVTIHSNDPVNSALQLRLSADVVAAGEEHAAPPEPKRTHPPEARLVLTGACAKCHAPRSAGESGAKLFASTCAACHGERGQGVAIGKEQVGPMLRLASMSVKTAEGLTQVISAGTGHPFMPGFGREYGGQLTDAQVASLVRLILKTFPAR